MKPLPVQFKRFIVSLFIFCCVIVTPFGFVSSSAAYSVPSDTIVYITPTGSKYHRYKCTYTSTVSSMTIAAAEQAGYGPCSRCRPDIRTGTYTKGSKIITGPSSSSSNNATATPSLSSSYKPVSTTPVPTVSAPISKQSSNEEQGFFYYIFIAVIIALFIFLPKHFDKEREARKQIASEQYSKGLQAGYAKAQNEIESAKRELQTDREALFSQQQQLNVRSRALESEYLTLEQQRKDFENELKKKAAPIARKKSSDYIISLLKATSLNNHFSGSRVFRAIADSSNKDLLARFESAQTKTIHFADSINVFTRMYGSKGEVYEVSLDSCTCPDFTRRKVGACKHMLKLALELSLLTSDENDSPTAK